MSEFSVSTTGKQASLKNDKTPLKFSKVAPPGAAEEFAGALEAATGQAQQVIWEDPMDGPQIKDAFDKILTSARPDRGLDVLVRSGVLLAVMPDVFALVGFGEGIRHKDVWMHTKQVILQTPPRLEVRWAALLHDVGKVPTRKFEPSGQVTFIGHPEVGARMFDKMCGRIPFPEESRQRVRFLIAAHLRGAAFSQTWTESAIRRFAKDVGDHLGDLLDLSRGDITSKYPEKVRRGLRQIDTLAAAIKEVQEKDAKPAPLPTGLGNAIITHFGIRPGPGLGRLMKRLMDQVEAGHIEGQSTFDYYIAHVQRHPELLALAQN